MRVLRAVQVLAAVGDAFAAAARLAQVAAELALVLDADADAVLRRGRPGPRRTACARTDRARTGPWSSTGRCGHGPAQVPTQTPSWQNWSPSHVTSAHGSGWQTNMFVVGSLTQTSPVGAALRAARAVDARAELADVARRAGDLGARIDARRVAHRVELAVEARRAGQVGAGVGDAAAVVHAVHVARGRVHGCRRSRPGRGTRPAAHGATQLPW